MRLRAPDEFERLCRRGERDTGLDRGSTERAEWVPANASTHVSARGQRALLGLGARGGMQARPSLAVAGLHRPKSGQPQRRGSRACSRRQGQAAVPGRNAWHRT